MLCRSCTRSFMQRLNIYKKFKQLEEPTFQRVSNQCTQPPLPVQLERYRHKPPSAYQEMFRISHPWHAERMESCKEGNTGQTLQQWKLENNCSDCNQLAVSLKHSLQSLGQPARQSSSQEEGADRKSWWGIRHSRLRTGMETGRALLLWSFISAILEYVMATKCQLTTLCNRKVLCLALGIKQQEQSTLNNLQKVTCGSRDDLYAFCTLPEKPPFLPSMIVLRGIYVV